MTPLQKLWLSIAKKHGLTVDVPFNVRLADGAEIVAEVRLRDYGAVNGMLIISDESALGGRSDDIVALGYGYSCFLQPPEDMIGSCQDLSNILDDWGGNTK